MVKFSVIVPVYNVEKYLRQCVDSVLSQTHSSFELILVDDGSNDCSGAICDEYANCDSRISVIHQANGGLAYARNTGIDCATGDYVIFLDSDDCWPYSRMLESINSSINTLEGVPIPLFWQFQRFGDNDTIYGTDLVTSPKQYTIRDDYAYLFKNNLLFASACHCAVPREWFFHGKLHFVVGDLSEDVEWYAELLSMMNRLLVYDVPFYAYRRREGSISNTTGKKSIEMMQKHISILECNSTLRSEIVATYIAEQIANYCIVISLSREHDIESIWKDRYSVLIRKAVRLRSRLIGKTISVFGIRCTSVLLRVAANIKHSV